MVCQLISKLTKQTTKSLNTRENMYGADAQHTLNFYIRTSN